MPEVGAIVSASRLAQTQLAKMNRQTESSKPQLSSRNKETIGEFFSAVGPMVTAYTRSHFSYAAVKQKRGYSIIKARLRLTALPSVELPKTFASKRVIAGAHGLDELGWTAEELIAKLCEGHVELPEGVLEFAAASGRQYHIGFTPLHDEGLLSQNRISVLTIQGGRVEGLVPQPDLDWHLKAGELPYDGVGELLTEYGLGTLRTDGCVLEVVADAVAFIDTGSRLSGSDAHISIRAARGLRPELITVGYRVLLGGRTLKRARINGTDLRWEAAEEFSRGDIRIDVPLGSVVHTIVSCGAVAQHQYYLLDPSRLPNAMRTAFEAFDEGLGSLTAILDSAEGRSYEARDLEAAVSWILAMHGFVGVHIGGTRKQISGPDNIAMAPSGNFAVIECTTKHLGSDKKLPDLVANSEKLRRKLDAAGQQHRTILPVLVTSLRAPAILAEVADAEKLGVLVLTRENLDNLLVRSLTVPAANQLYEEGIEMVRAGLKKYQT